jgi:hypothetical protein
MLLDGGFWRYVSIVVLTVCLRETSVKKAKKARSLSPPNGAPRRIGAVADEERSRSKFH